MHANDARWDLHVAYEHVCAHGIAANLPAGSECGMWQFPLTDSERYGVSLQWSYRRCTALLA